MTEKKKKFNKAEYDNNFHKENYVQIAFRLRKEKDSDIISKLQSIENKPEYFRQLIRNDIKKDEK